MRSPGLPAAHRDRARRALAALLLLVSGTYFYLSVWRAPVAITHGRGAAPWTDGAEYLGGAASLAREGRYHIHLAGEELPSRYPPGYSLLLAAGLLAGVEVPAAPTAVGRLAGLVLLCLIGGVLWWRGRPLAAALAVSLLSTTPAFVILCRAPLSEIASTVLLFAGVACLYASSGGGSMDGGGPEAEKADLIRFHGLAALGACLLGTSVFFRTAHLFFYAFLPAVVWMRSGSPLAAGAAGLGRWFRRTLEASLPLVLGALAGLSPLWAYNLYTFGRPWASGYGYWVPFWDTSRALGLEYVPENLSYYWRDLMSLEVPFTSADLYGTGTYYGPALALLISTAPFAASRARRVVPFALAGVAYVAVMLAYFLSDGRFLFPAVALAIPAAAVGLCSLGSRRRTWVSSLGVAAGGLLWLLAVVGWPGLRGISTTWALVAEPRGIALQPAYRVLEQARRLPLAAGSVVLTDMPPPYVHAWMPATTLVAPLRDDHSFRFNPSRFRFADAERRALLGRATAEGRPVWVVAQNTDIWRLELLSPAPDGFAWEVVALDGHIGGLARLVARDPRLPPTASGGAHEGI